MQRGLLPWIRLRLRRRRGRRCLPKEPLERGDDRGGLLRGCAGRDDAQLRSTVHRPAEGIVRGQ